MAMNTKSKEYLESRTNHEKRVIRNSAEFMTWFDRGAAAIFEGKSRGQAIDSLAPWGCDATQSNGVLAGICQALALMNG